MKLNPIYFPHSLQNFPEINLTCTGYLQLYLLQHSHTQGSLQVNIS